MTEVLPEETKKNYLASIPAGQFRGGRRGSRDWLASDEASYISGAVIPVDGAWAWVTNPTRTDWHEAPERAHPF